MSDITHKRPIMPPVAVSLVIFVMRCLSVSPNDIEPKRTCLEPRKKRVHCSTSYAGESWAQCHVLAACPKYIQVQRRWREDVACFTQRSAMIHKKVRDPCPHLNSYQYPFLNLVNRQLSPCARWRFADLRKGPRRESCPIRAR